MYGVNLLSIVINSGFTMVPLAGQEWSDVSNFLSQGLSLSVRDSLVYTGDMSGKFSHCCMKW